MTLILIANKQTSHSLNMHMQLSSRTRFLNFGYGPMYTLSMRAVKALGNSVYLYRTI